MGILSMPAEPVLRFYRVIDEARGPQRADRSAAGTLPARAARYCDAVTSAAAFGWYVFPPMEFSLLWDGADIFWTWPGHDGWLKLDSAQFPHLAERFDTVVPGHLAGCSPPFLTALPEPGTVQLWTGLIARTAADWSLLLRAPANLPASGGYVLYEGIVETDRWFGPLFTNLRLTRTDIPVRFKADMPLLQVQPLPRAFYADATLENVTVIDALESFAEQDWADYERTVVAPNRDSLRQPGRYAVEARRGRKRECPFANEGSAKGGIAAAL
jgi:hypothetical protein